MKYELLRSKILKKQIGGLLGTAAELGLSVIPGVGEAMDIAGIITGLATGNLSEAALSTLGLILPGVSGKSLKVGKKAVETLGQEGAELLAKRLVSKNINPKAERKIKKIFGIDGLDLKKVGNDILEESSKEFTAIHGYNKEDVLEQMSDLYANRKSLRKVYARAIEDNRQLAKEITENEQYLDVWYKLLNGTIEWPIFKKGNPNARDVVEAAISDLKQGRGTYIAMKKGSGDFVGRTKFEPHSIHDFGKMLFGTTESNTAANYTYTILGDKTAVKMKLLERKNDLLSLIKEDIIKMDPELQRLLLSNSSELISELNKRTEEITDIVEEMQDVYNEALVKLGTTKKAMAALMGKDDLFKPKHYEQFPDNFEKTELGKKTLKKLTELHEKLNRVLENKGMGTGQVKTGIVRIYDDDVIGIADWGSNVYNRGKHELPTFGRNISVQEIVKADKSKTRKKDLEVLDRMKSGNFHTGDELVGNMRKKGVDIGVIDNIRDPNISGTNIVLRSSDRFLISRKYGGYLNYVRNT